MSFVPAIRLDGTNFVDSGETIVPEQKESKKPASVWTAESYPIPVGSSLNNYVDAGEIGGYSGSPLSNYVDAGEIGGYSGSPLSNYVDAEEIGNYTSEGIPINAPVLDIDAWNAQKANSRGGSRGSRGDSVSFQSTREIRDRLASQYAAQQPQQVAQTAPVAAQNGEPEHEPDPIVRAMKLVDAQKAPVSLDPIAKGNQNIRNIRKFQDLVKENSPSARQSVIDFLNGLSDAEKDEMEVNFEEVTGDTRSIREYIRNEVTTWWRFAAQNTEDDVINALNKRKD